MNGVPRLSVVPGLTWMRPFGCSIVAGAMQVHDPSGLRRNA